MLDIFNNLSPFIEDCYRRCSVREYAKLVKISPPTASKVLKELAAENLLKKETFRNYLFFSAGRESKIFIDLARIYWRQKLEELKLLDYLQAEIMNPAVILFGSLSKAENKEESDIDIAVFGMKKDLNLKDMEKKLKRSIQVFFFDSPGNIKNKELLNNILNGSLLLGRWKF